jgi:transcription antitermination factor NusG
MIGIAPKVETIKVKQGPFEAFKGSFERIATLTSLT